MMKIIKIMNYYSNSFRVTLFSLTHLNYNYYSISFVIEYSNYQAAYVVKKAA